MLRVVIKAPDTKWVDHAGNEITELVFSKEHFSEYAPGHYAIDSFGSLDRLIDNFRQSPIQCLSEWEISIPAIYSSPDGSFQTVDLLYYLEAENEDFNLLGCDAELRDDGDVLFRGVVNSTATSGLKSSIRFMEKIGSPEIAAVNFPTPIGDAAVDKWKVGIKRMPWGFEVEITAGNVIADSIAYWLLNKGEFLKITEYYDDNGKVINPFWPDSLATRFQRDFPREVCLTIDSGLLSSQPVRVSPAPSTSPISAAYKMLNAIFPNLHPSPPEEPLEAERFLIGGGINNYQRAYYGLAEAWSRYLSKWNSNFYTTQISYDFGRVDINNPNSLYGNGFPYLNIFRFTSGINIQAAIEVPVEGILTGSPVIYKYDQSFTYGNPQAMREFSKDKSPAPLSEAEWENFPTVVSPHDNFELFFDFPELNLPAGAKITKVELQFRVQLKYCNCFFNFGDLYHDLAASLDFISDKADAWGSMDITLAAKDKSASALRRLKMFLRCYPDDSTTIPLVRFAGLRLAVTFLVPLNENTELYASGTQYVPTSTPGVAGEPDAGNSVVQSANSLLAAAKVNYEVESTLPNSAMRYGSIRLAAAKLRDKLRSLAAESGTLIRFSPTANQLMLSSVSMQEEQNNSNIPLIPLSAFALENNMPSFRMESPERDDIASGVVVSWGKNTVTNKYEHTFEVNSTNAFSDGQPYSDSKIGENWNPIRENIAKNNGALKNLDSEWILDWVGAEAYAYNYLCWNSVPLRKAQCVCIYTELKKLEKDIDIDIGSFVRFDLPGYHEKLRNTSWVVTGRNDNLDSMETTLELLEAYYMPKTSGWFLLLEDGGNILTEDVEKIKMEDFYG